MKRLLCDFILMGPIIITIQDMLNVNLQYTVLLILLLTLNILSNRNIKNITFIFLIWFYTIFQISNSFFELGLVKSFILFICITYFFTRENNLEYLKKHLLLRLKFIQIQCILVLFLNTLYFFTSIGWQSMWGSKVFLGYMDFPHETAYFLGALSIFFMALYMLDTNNNRKYVNFLFATISVIFCGFTNTRTIFLAILTIYIYYITKVIKNKKLTVPMLILLGIFIILLNEQYKFINIEEIPIINKFIHTSENENMLSSRDLIWKTIKDYYINEFNIIEKIIGCGFGVTKYINKLYLGVELWGHNDILEILMSWGIIGVCIYTNSFIRILKITKSYLCSIILLVIALWNGLFIYNRFIFAIPIIIVLFKLIKEHKKDDKNEEVYSIY